jgi:hypothetical protein
MPSLFEIMKRSQQTNYIIFSGVTILTVLVASILITGSIYPTPKVMAQLIGNSSNVTGTLANQSVSQSTMSPKSLMQSVIEKTINTNATGFATKQIISNTGNTTNNTLANANNTAMKSVIAKTQNTNATNFASENLINATKK